MNKRQYKKGSKNLANGVENAFLLKKKTKNKTIN